MSDLEFNDQHLAPNRYFDHHFNKNAVKILPGEYFVTKEDTLIVTVLGSCVSVCLRDPVRSIGGMNHFLLPNEGEGNTNTEWSESARYGAFAMEILINHLVKVGARKNSLEAKVFGGGNVLQGFTNSTVGERNVEFVLDFLQTEQIPILGSDLLDQYPRKVYFFPQSGKVMLKKIRSLHNSTIIDRESEYRMRIRQVPKSGSVDLF